MLIHPSQPLERGCRASWNALMMTIATALVVAISGLRLDAGDSKPDPAAPSEKKVVKEESPPKPEQKPKEETLHYSGKVTDKELSLLTGTHGVKAVDRLVALANERGGDDNISVVIVEVKIPS